MKKRSNFISPERSPFQGHAAIYKAYSECLHYFEDPLETKKAQMDHGEYEEDGTSTSIRPGSI